MNDQTSRLRRLTCIFIVFIWGVVLNQAVIAGELAPPFTWNSGDTLSSSDLNGNFSAIDDAVDDNALDIVTNANAITALETNKPSLAFDRTVCTGIVRACQSDFLAQTVSTVTSVSIDAPVQGRVVVTFSSQYLVEHTFNNQDTFCVEVFDNNSAIPIPSCDGNLNLLGNVGASHRFVNIPANFATNTFNGSLHSQQVFTVGAGSHTFFVRGQSNSTGTNIHLRQSNAIAYFVPD